MLLVTLDNVFAAPTLLLAKAVGVLVSLQPAQVDPPQRHSGAIRETSHLAEANAFVSR